MIPKFLLCQNKGDKQQYVLHTQSPRFLAVVKRNADRSIDINPTEFYDNPVVDAVSLAKLMRELGDWYSTQM
jgi:hypothetical protein